jgi:HAE1 family hydrophobic/amphiphilic exporter-1
VKGWIRIAVTHPVGVSVVCLAIALLGIVSLRQIPTDLLPEVDVPWISITTQYEGVAPEEIETLLTRPIEQAVSTVAGVDRIDATSSEGLSRVQLQFGWGVKVEQALDDVRIAIDRVRRVLPDGSDPPNIFKFDLASMPVVNLGVSGSADQRTLKQLAEDDLSRALERLPGVASVDARGGRDREIRVEVSAHRLTSLGVSIREISQALARENRTVSAGDVRDSGQQVVVRTAGEFESVTDIENTVIKTREGTPIRVRDVGEVKDTIRRVRSELYIDHQPSIELRVFKQSGANTVEVTSAVQREVERLNVRFGERAQLAVLYDASDYIRAAVRGVQSSAAIGALLAVLVLLLFLRSVSATLVVATAIPLSVLATFSLIFSEGMTLNLISFGGLALGIGILVDGAVVILESIYRKREAGASALDSAVDGAHEVGSAVVAGTLTTMAVFVPVIFVGGLSGVLFSEMAAVVTFSLFCALLVALSLVPMLAAKLLTRDETEQRDQRTSDGRIGRALGALDERYGRLVASVLQAPWAIVVGALVLLGSSVVMADRIGLEMMPESDEARIEADIELPVGTPLDVTHEILLDAERRAVAALARGELEHVVTSIGPEAWWRGQGSNEGEIELLLVPRGERTRTVLEIEPEIRRALTDLPGAKLRVRPSSANLLSRIIRRGEDRLSVEIRGHDLETADVLAREVVRRMTAVEGVTYARPDRELGQLERVVDVDRQRAAELGLSNVDVAETIEHYVLGFVSTRLRERGDEIDIRVQLDESEVSRLGQLPELPLITAAGVQVPLHSVATLHERVGPSSIKRIDQERTVQVNAGTANRPLNDIGRDIRRSFDDLEVPDGFTVSLGGELAEQDDTFYDLLLGILLSLFLVYATMAVQFESIRQPLMIMLSVPFAFIGVAGALLLTDTTFNMNSFLGAIVLVGIVVNNAIVLVDTTNTLRRRDAMPLREAVITSCKRRLRPILMTTLTTLLGLVPLAIGLGEGSEMQAPLARTVIGGLTTSTMVTLLLVPCAYYLVERGRARRPASAAVPATPAIAS